jgi:hypothetical protein
LSGPKVVRIVTREERIAICQDQLALLRAALLEWERVGNRNDLLQDEDVKNCRKRCGEIAALLETDRFTDLQKQVAEEIAFLKNDMTRRLEVAAKKAADARTRKRRLVIMAQQAQKRVNEGGAAISAALRVELETIAGGQLNDEHRAESALAETLSLSLAKSDPSKLTGEQHELAKRLRGNNPAATLAFWMQTNASEADKAGSKIDVAIAELEVAGAHLEAAVFAKRQQAIPQEPSPERQRMLSDSLLMEVGQIRNQYRERVQQLSQLRELAAQLTLLKCAAAEHISKRTEEALAREDAGAAHGLIAEIVTLIASERKALATAAQRGALLSTLKELGYEVREGMQTAWAKEGRVVLRRAAIPEMGVEIMSPHGAERLQFRPVRFGAATSAAGKHHDRDIETLWCSDFDRLRQHLELHHGTLNVEKAMPVGAVPVLRVAEDNVGETRRPETAITPKVRKT